MGGIVVVVEGKQGSTRVCMSMPHENITHTAVRAAAFLPSLQFFSAVFLYTVWLGKQKKHGKYLRDHGRRRKWYRRRQFAKTIVTGHRGQCCGHMVYLGDGPGPTGIARVAHPGMADRPVLR